MSSTMPKKKNGFMSVVRETIRVYTVNEMSVYAGYTTLYILMAMVPLLTLHSTTKVASLNAATI